MNGRCGLACGLALVALVLGGTWFCLTPSTARADEEGYTETETIKNDTIDCTTNPGYTDKYVARAFQDSQKRKSPLNMGSDCRACHQNEHPRVGTGDRPPVEQASVLVQNRSTSRSISFQVRKGKDGEWEKRTLKPNAIERITYKYPKSKVKAKDRSSPVYYLKYDGDPAKKARKLVPMATPNPKLGNVYFFEEDQGVVRLYQPGKSVGRQKK